MKIKLPENKINQVREILPTLSINDLNSFLDISSYKLFNNKKLVISEGSTSKKAFLILNGIVRGYILTNKGEEKTILLRSNGVFVTYPNAAFNNEPSKYNYESIGNTEALIFSVDAFQELAEREIGIKNLYLSILKEATSVLNYRVETMITMSNEERYIDLVKRNPLFLESAYKKDIAYYLGITPVSLSRIIKRIK